MHCGKTAERIWMSFGLVGRTGPWMRQVVGFHDGSTGMGNFWRSNLGRATVTMGICGVPVQMCVNRRSCSLGWCVGWAEALLY